MIHLPSSFRILLLTLTVVLGALLVPRQAAACGSAGGGASYTGLAVLAATIVIPAAAADVGFTGYDIVKAAQGERASRGMAIGEVAVTLPQAVLGGLVTAETQQPTWPLFAYTGWMTVLAVHGIATFTTAPPPAANDAPPPEPDPTKPQVSFAPTMLSDGTKLAPGLGAVGRF